MKEHTSLKEGDRATVQTNGREQGATVLGKQVLEAGDYINFRLDGEENEELFLLMVAENGRLVVKKAISFAESPS